jgi:hypothetical protein
MTDAELASGRASIDAALRRVATTAIADPPASPERRARAESQLRSEVADGEAVAAALERRATP